MARHASSTIAPDLDWPRTFRVPHKARARLEAAIEAAIALIDRLDGDPDLEPEPDGEASADAELWIQHELRGGARVAA